jgi:hypothetical protein
MKRQGQISKEALLGTLSGEAFCFLAKKNKTLTNNFKHKTLKTIFTPLYHIITLSTKKQKTPSKKCYQTNPIYNKH